MYTKDSVKTYKFASIEFSVRNYRGVYFLSDNIKAQIAALTLEEAKKVNTEAWKQKRAQGRIVERHCNVSVSENGSIYEEAASHYDVASQIAKESYKRMLRG
jgi:hypothetical protein